MGVGLGVRVGLGDLKMAFDLLGLVLGRAAFVVSPTMVAVSANNVRHVGLLHGRCGDHGGADDDSGKR